MCRKRMKARMKRRYQKKSDDQTEIAKQRISILLERADNVFCSEKDLADRYVALARKISMKCKVRLPSALKRRICPSCHRFLKPGVNLRVRLSKSRIIYSCLECKHFWRMPYIAEIKERRKAARAKTEKPSRKPSETL